MSSCQCFSPNESREKPINLARLTLPAAQGLDFDLPPMQGRDRSQVPRTIKPDSGPTDYPFIHEKIKLSSGVLCSPSATNFHLEPPLSREFVVADYQTTLTICASADRLKA